MTRTRHNPAYLASRDMLAECENGDAYACQYLVDHPEALQLEPEPERTSWATMFIGAVIVWVLAMAFFNIPIWSQ